MESDERKRRTRSKSIEQQASRDEANDKHRTHRALHTAQ